MKTCPEAKKILGYLHRVAVPQDLMSISLDAVLANAEVFNMAVRELLERMPAIRSDQELMSDIETVRGLVENESKKVNAEPNITCSEITSLPPPDGLFLPGELTKKRVLDVGSGLSTWSFLNNAPLVFFRVDPAYAAFSNPLELPSIAQFCKFISDKLGLFYEQERKNEQRYYEFLKSMKDSTLISGKAESFTLGRNQKFDYIFSNAFLGYLSEKNIRLAMKNMFSYLDKGGQMRFFDVMSSFKHGENFIPTNDSCFSLLSGLHELQTLFISTKYKLYILQTTPLREDERGFGSQTFILATDSHPLYFKFLSQTYRLPLWNLENITKNEKGISYKLFKI